MSNIESPLAADEARRAAMVAADCDALSQHLSADLVWTHSSGRIDDKAAVLESITSGSVEYLALDNEDVATALYGDICLYFGIVVGRVRKGGAERNLRNKFLSVWKWADPGWHMLAWQSCDRRQSSANGLFGVIVWYARAFDALK